MPIPLNFNTSAISPSVFEIYESFLLNSTASFLTGQEIVLFSSVNKTISHAFTKSLSAPIWQGILQTEQLPLPKTRVELSKAYYKKSKLESLENQLKFLKNYKLVVDVASVDTAREVAILKEYSKEFSLWSISQKQAFLDHWNTVIGLHQLRETANEYLLTGLTAITPQIVNRLHTLNQRNPRGLIEYLSITENHLQVLPDNLLTGLTNLKAVNLADNQLPVLPANLFTGLRNLQAINLSDNLLSELPPFLFFKLASLRKLSLRNNRIQSI